MAKQLRINISFPKYEKHIYDFLDEHDNASALVRQLVGAYMSGNIHLVQGMNANVGEPAFAKPIIKQEVKVEKVMKEEVKKRDANITTEAEDITKTGLRNLASLKDSFC